MDYKKGEIRLGEVVHILYLCSKDYTCIMFNFKSEREFNDFFHSEEACYKFFEQVRWEGKPICPHCGSTKEHRLTKSRNKTFPNIPTYRCSERSTCNLPFTVRTKSIFDGSKIPMRDWFKEIFEMSIRKKGISSMEAGKRLGISQKSAWLINHQIREMLIKNGIILSGEVEVDETYVGGKNINRHVSKKVKNSQGRACIDKTPVIGLVERDGRIKTVVVSNTNKDTVQSVVKKHVSPDSTVITDAYDSYKGLENSFKEHISVKHTVNDYRTPKDMHTNNIEGYWSGVKKAIHATFHSVSRHHLPRYCAEFDSRYNDGKNHFNHFFVVVNNLSKKKITYHELTNQPGKKIRKPRQKK